MTRTRLLSLALLAFAVLVLGTGAGQAQAAGYRYWSFWQSSGDEWTYATEGPATARPADGSVNGFRFSVSADSGDAAQPRTAPDFEAVCGGTPPKSGTKRIAVVIDPGTPADARDGETPPGPQAKCARVAEDATSADALASVAKPLRYNSQALLCAIAGYPESGCGEQVSGDRPTVEPEPGATSASAASEGRGGDDGGPSVGLFAGMAAVLALGVAAVWQSRRRRS
ncbi:SCO2322 family protein [Streptomyces sp. NPDC052236]|uniref:SCO2322 family protein n=1 Tax=Streptomyces sp. NPDC052236 TaxID=3365686 RepID=UPI0037D69087